MKWRLACVIVDEGSAIGVDIAPDISVAPLQREINLKLAYTDMESDKLSLFVAKEDGPWLQHDNSDIVHLLTTSECRQGLHDLLERGSPLHPDVLIKDALAIPTNCVPEASVVHLLVTLPEQGRQRIGLRAKRTKRDTTLSTVWCVKGAITDAHLVHGARYTLHQLAEWHYGYHGSNLRYLREPRGAIWYDDKSLSFSILFKGGKSVYVYVIIVVQTADCALVAAEYHARKFEAQVWSEAMPGASPLVHLELIVCILPLLTAAPSKRERVVEYCPSESRSPQTSLCSSDRLSNVTIAAMENVTFQYQSIEHPQYFKPIGTAERCHVMSKRYCISHKPVYKDHLSNTLALSRDIRDFYDGMNCVVPMFALRIDSVSENTIDNRYKVPLQTLSALDVEHYKVQPSLKIVSP